MNEHPREMRQLAAQATVAGLITRSALEYFGALPYIDGMAWAVAADMGYGDRAATADRRTTLEANTL